jgi:hypothetical protein
MRSPFGKSGSTRLTGQSRPSFPRSARRRTAAAVIGFDTEAMWNFVAMVLGTPKVRSASPKACS